MLLKAYESIAGELSVFLKVRVVFWYDLRILLKEKQRCRSKPITIVILILILQEVSIYLQKNI